MLFAMVNGKLPFNDTSVKNLLAAINKGITFQSNVSEGMIDNSIHLIQEKKQHNLKLTLRIKSDALNVLIFSM